MKKIFTLCLLSLFLVLCLVGCSCNADKDNTYDNDEKTEENEGENNHTHEFSGWIKTKDPTCKDYGEEKRECKCGEVEKRNVEKLSHTRDNAVKENEILPTCQREGSYEAVVYCTVCHEKIDSETVTIEKTAHKPSRLTTTAEYCNGVAVSNVYCGDCGEYVTSYGHKYKESSALPTCTQDGYKSLTCVVCGDSETQIIDAFGHMGNGWETVTVSSCTSGGYIVNKCSFCKTVIEEKTTEKLEHIYVGAVKNENLVYTCVDCGDSFTEEIEDDIYTVDFVTNGGNSCQSIVVKAGEIVNLPTVEKDDLCLRGWFYDNSGETEYFDEPIYKDTTLYAIWQEKEIVTISDNSIKTSVNLDFAFDIVLEEGYAKDEVLKYISVYDVSDKVVNISVISKGNGVFTIVSDEYETGSFYYAIVKSPARFSDTEKTEMQFTTKGEDKNNVVLNNSVATINSLDIYGIIEDNGQNYILTTVELVVGKNVAIYEGIQDNIQSVVKILSKREMYGFKAYTFEMADYNEAFDSFELNTSTDVNFESFELDLEAEKEIKAQFMNSPLYNQAKGAAQMLATVEGTVLENTTVEFSIYEDGEDIVTSITLEFRFKKAFSIKVIVENRLSIHSESYVRDVDDYAFITTNTLDTRIHVEASAGISDEFFEKGNTLVPKEGQTYADLIDKYKELFANNKYDQIGLVDKKGDAKKYIRLGKTRITVNGVVIYVEIGFEADVFFGGIVGAEMNIRTVETTGIRNGNKIDDKSIELRSASFFAKGKAEVNPKIVLEIGANACGLIFYVKGDYGPYIDAGLAGALVFNGQQFIKADGSAYLDMGFKYSIVLGVKYQIELWGYDLKLYDFNIPIIDKKDSRKTIGTPSIVFGFADYEDPISKSHKCDEDVEISLDAIDANVLVQDFIDLKITEESSKAKMYITNVSGYNSCISLKNKRLYLDNVPEKVTVTVSVKYNEIITKDIEITVDVDHPADCIHMKCTDHTGGRLTCTSKAICEVCGLEYGEEPKGHVWQGIACSVCGEYKGSEGIEYELVGDEYHVVGKGYCNSKEIVIASKYNGVPVTCIADSAFKDEKGIESIKIPSSVLIIDEDAFLDCTSLKNVSMSSNIKRIDDTAFEGCTNLEFNEYDNALYLGNEENLYVALIRSKDVGITSCVINEKTKIISDYAFLKNTDLVSVDIPKSITDIGRYAFFGCLSLIEVNIAEDSTLTNIYESAFKFAGLTSIQLPDSIINIASSAFEWDDLEYYEHDNALYLGNVKNPYVLLKKIKDKTITSYSINEQTKIIFGNVFRDCINLTSIEIPNGVVNIEWSAFEDCTGLTSITIPDSVINIGIYAFSGCSSLTSINIPASVTEISSGLFCNCTNLTNVKLPIGITRIGDFAFNSCTSLTSFDIPRGVISIGVEAFGGCTNLTNINLTDGIVSIGGSAFSWCERLTDIVIPSSVTNIGREAFYQCKNLKTVYITDIASWCNIEFGDEFANPFSVVDNVYLNGTPLTSIAIPDSVKEIGDYAFYSCSRLASITLPNDLKSIGDCAFYGCESVASLTIPDSVEYIGERAFYGCTGLTVYFVVEEEPAGWHWNWDAHIEERHTLYPIQSVVWNCNGNEVAKDGYIYVVVDGVRYGIKDGVATVARQPKNSEKVVISKSIYYNGRSYTVTKIAEKAFQSYNTLISITIPNSVTSIGEDAFYNCVSATIYCEHERKPSGWYSNWNNFGKTVVWDCNNNDVAEDGYVYTMIEGIKYGIKDGVATVVKQPRNIENAIILKSIVYSGASYPVISIVDEAFYGSTLISVTIPNSIKSIGKSAFAYCYRLKSIIIPSSVTSVGGFAFSGWEDLTIYCETKKQPSGWDESWNNSDHTVVWGYKEQ